MLLLFALFAYSLAGKCESIEGNWTNELGSTALFADFNDGTFIGRYQTKVTGGVHYCDPNQIASILSGTYQDTKDGCLLNFVVQWDMCDQNNNTIFSTTTWIGKYFSKDKVYFETQWLLLLDTPRQAAWSNMLIGRNTFTRTD